MHVFTRPQPIGSRTGIGNHHNDPDPTPSGVDGIRLPGVGLVSILRHRAALRRRLRPFSLLLLLLLLMATAWPTPSPAGQKDGTLEFYWVDSEGGGSTLIVTPLDETILIDSGNPGGRDSKRIVQVLREVAGLSRIDHLITTHFHLDHFGGAAEIAQEVPIGTVYDNGIPERNPDNNPNDTRFPLLIKPYREMQAKARVTLKPGDTVPLRTKPGSPALRVRFIGGRQQFVPAQAPGDANPRCAEARAVDKDLSDNANSVVTLVEFGGFRYLNCGDLTWNTEADLVCPQNRIGTVDVFQVNHHGLDVSNNPLLIQSIAPTVSIMNNGPRKGCGPKTFAALRATPSIQAMYQVHRNVQAGVDGNTAADMIANAEEKCSAQHLRLAVAEDGGSYTVRVPSTGHQRTFKSKH